MLSEKRKELLRKNKNKIAAVLVKNGKLIETECCYKYDNGVMCAASACLTDDERNAIYCAGYNSKTIKAVAEAGLVDIKGEELETLNIFQAFHDEYLSDGVMYSDFERELERLLLD